MIHYTIKGFFHHLELHETKIVLEKKGLLMRLGRGQQIQSWAFDEIIEFQIKSPKKFLFGTLQWRDAYGKTMRMHYKCSNLIMGKITCYIQKILLKNQPPSINKEIQESSKAA